MHLYIQHLLLWPCGHDNKFASLFSSYTTSLLFRVGRESAVGVATTLRAGRSEDRIPMGARFSAPALPSGPPSLCTMGTGSFPGLKRPWRGVDHPPRSSAEVKERIELYIYSPLWAFMAGYREDFTFHVRCLTTLSSSKNTERRRWMNK